MKKAALYVRVSTGHQIDKDSLPHQRKELKNYCKHVLHLDNLEIFEDAGRSGKNTDRPAFQRMMNKIESDEISHVIVYKIDRISRNLVDFSLMYDKFREHRVTFISLNEQFDTSSAIGEAVLKIILVFAELERKLTSERVTDIMLDRASAGLWNGANMPLGYHWDEETKFPSPDEIERKTVELIFNMYDECHSSTIITRYLNDNGIRTKRNGEWTTKTVADIIRNPFYKGTYRYNYRNSPHGKIRPEEEWIVREDNHPAIISKEQWARCNIAMDKNATGKNLPGFEPMKKHIHIFGGICTCGECGSNMHAGKDDKRADGFWPSQYRCASRARKTVCSAKPASDVRIGPFIFKYIVNFLSAYSKRNTLLDVKELENILLDGKEFKNVAYISSSTLNEIFNLLKGRSYNVAYQATSTIKSNHESSSLLDKKRTEVEKYTRALDRLKKAYLFDDDSMSEEEYLSTKRDLEVNLIAAKNKIAELEDDIFNASIDESAFISSASSFILTQKLKSGEVNFKELMLTIDNKVLKDFIRAIVDDIVILKSMPSVITFKNGLVHEFIYKE
ncbi:MAG TPA: resolvase [Lachnospiraceae bacterium]|nr:recombinase family protein [uncultured Lachnoclostridium sp.]HAU84022.1 resolvase [Lachnospiraceae bacterium]